MVCQKMCQPGFVHSVGTSSSGRSELHAEPTTRLGVEDLRSDQSAVWGSYVLVAGVTTGGHLGVLAANARGPWIRGESGSRTVSVSRSATCSGLPPLSAVGTRCSPTRSAWLTSKGAAVNRGAAEVSTECLADAQSHGGNISPQRECRGRHILHGVHGAYRRGDAPDPGTLSTSARSRTGTKAWAASQRLGRRSENSSGRHSELQAGEGPLVGGLLQIASQVRPREQDRSRSHQGRLAADSVSGHNFQS